MDLGADEPCGDSVRERLLAGLELPIAAEAAPTGFAAFDRG